MAWGSVVAEAPKQGRLKAVPARKAPVPPAKFPNAGPHLRAWDTCQRQLLNSA